MGPLLDTHAALWWLADDERLPGSAKSMIASTARPLLSAGTVFEVAIKASLDKLDVPENWVEELLAEGFELLPISPAHASRLREMPFVRIGGTPHRDPFDHLLVAQAAVEEVPIVTRDAGIVAYGAPTVW